MMPVQSTGSRNRSTKASQRWLNRKGWIERRLARLSRTWLTMPRATVATAAPGPESVITEMNKPMAANPDTPATMYTAANPIRSSAPPVEIVDPESVGSGPTPMAMAPATSPASATKTTPAATSAMTDDHFERINRTRPTGRTSRYRRVPAEDSPATASPASSPVPSGRKNGCTSAMAASGANRPACRSWSKNAGPPDASGEFRSTITGSTPNAASPAANTQVRTRCSDFRISTRNIGALHQREEHVLEAGPLRDQGADRDAGSDQRPADV